MLTSHPTAVSSEDGSDEALMARWLGGDERAFAALHRRYVKLVTRIAGAGVRDREDARCLVQQTFLRVHRCRDSFQLGRPLRPWLVTIARNTRRDYLRRARHHRELPLTWEVANEEPGCALERSQTVTRVRTALARLSPNQRSVLAARWYAGYSYSEIAEDLGATHAAIKLRAFRAHATLRTLLAA